MLPTLGRVVIYESKNGDGIKSPAIVLRTKMTIRAEIDQQKKEN